MSFDPNSKKAKRLQRTQELVALGVLQAPIEFATAKLYELDLVCNGCGAAGAKFDFIPDTIWGIYIGEACHIHDWQYHEGLSQKDKDDADWQFLKNLISLIRYKSKWYSPTLLMCARASLYYWAVQKHGDKAFWNGKL